MMYYVITKTLRGKNALQKALIRVVEGWMGCLIDDDEAKTCFIERMEKTVDYLNAKNPKCKPCLLTRSQNAFGFKVHGDYDNFATFYLLKVKSTYDGILHCKEEEGGAE